MILFIDVIVQVNTRVNTGNEYDLDILVFSYCILSYSFQTVN